MFGFSKNAETFKAKIRVGASVGQDFCWGKWPWCKAPGGGDEAANPDMIFEATANDDVTMFDLRAHGFGLHGTNNGYGNGSMTVYGLDGLILDNAVRKKLAAKKRALLEAKKSELKNEIAKLDAELATVR